MVGVEAIWKWVKWFGYGVGEVVFGCSHERLDQLMREWWLEET